MLNNKSQSVSLDVLKSNYKENLIKNTTDFLFRFDTISKNSNKEKLTDFYRTIGR